MVRPYSVLVTVIFAASAAAFGCSATEEMTTEEFGVSGEALARHHHRHGEVVVFSSEFNRLHTNELDQSDGELTWVSTVTLPEQVHYAAPDPKSKYLYVSSSNGSTNHWLYAFTIDKETGALTQHGQPLVPPGGRIIHLSVDKRGDYLVVAHNQTSQVATVRLNDDGTLGEFVVQEEAATTGFYTHQALIDDRNHGVVAAGLGAAATDTQPEQAGSLTVFQYDDGQLTKTQSIIPGPGLGPRHLDYNRDEVYVGVERGNRLYTYDYEGGVLGETPKYDIETLIDSTNVRPRQRVGAIHVHPSGKFLYLSNRADQNVSGTIDGQPVQYFLGGENNIAGYRLSRRNGEPTLIGHWETQGFEARTFTIEPRGRWLIVANQATRNVLEEDGTLTSVPRSLVVFDIDCDGELSQKQKYDFFDGEVFWVGSIELPR
jgi:6-phosphogluconolactonase